VHDVDAVVDLLPRAEVNGISTLGSTAGGQGSSARGAAAVDGNHGPETEGFPQHVLEGLAGFQAGEGDAVVVGAGGSVRVVRAEGGDDGVAQRGEGGRVPEEQVEEPGEEGGGGVAAREQDVQELSAEFEGVAGLLRQGFKEDVLLLLALIGRLGVFGLGALGQRQSDVVVHELVHGFIVLFVLLGVVEPVVVRQAEAAGHVHLRRVEVAGECGFVVRFVRGRRVASGFRQLAVDRFAEEELAGGVQSQAEEPGAWWSDHGFFTTYSTLRYDS